MPLEAAVVADVAFAVGTDRGAVGSAAGQRRHRFGASRHHPREAPGENFDNNHRAVAERHRTLGKLQPFRQRADFHDLHFRGQPGDISDQYQPKKSRSSLAVRATVSASPASRKPSATWSRPFVRASPATPSRPAGCRCARLISGSREAAPPARITIIRLSGPKSKHRPRQGRRKTGAARSKEFQHQLPIPVGVVPRPLCHFAVGEPAGKGAGGDRSGVGLIRPRADATGRQRSARPGRRPDSS